MTLAPPGPHLELVTLILSMASPDLLPVVTFGSSPGPEVSVPTWASPGRGDGFPQGPHLDLVTQVLIWASWDLVSQVHIGASPGPSDSLPTLGLTLKW